MPVQSSARPVASVLDVVVDDNHVLMVRRINPPDAGKWGHPGGWIDLGETMAQAAVRELLEGTEMLTEAWCVFNALDAFDYDDGGTASAIRDGRGAMRMGFGNPHRGR